MQLTNLLSLLCILPHQGKQWEEMESKDSGVSGHKALIKGEKTQVNSVKETCGDGYSWGQAMKQRSWRYCSCSQQKLKGEQPRMALIRWLGATVHLTWEAASGHVYGDGLGLGLLGGLGGAIPWLGSWTV